MVLNPMPREGKVYSGGRSGEGTRHESVRSPFFYPYFISPSRPRFSGGRSRRGARLPSPRGRGFRVTDGEARPSTREHWFSAKALSLLNLSFAIREMGVEFFPRPAKVQWSIREARAFCAGRELSGAAVSVPTSASPRGSGASPTPPSSHPSGLLRLFSLASPGVDKRRSLWRAEVSGNIRGLGLWRRGGPRGLPVGSVLLSADGAT